jgi:sulfotransferase
MLFTPNTHPVMNPIFSLKNLKEICKEKMSKNFLFINYEELVNETENTIKKIYEFCGWEPFIHNFKNVTVKYPEDDLFYGIKGMHDIKPVVKKQPNLIEIPESVLSNCIICNKLLGYV